MQTLNGEDPFGPGIRTSTGIAFAVPVWTLERIVPQIIKYGRAQQVGIGIRVDEPRNNERSLGMERGMIVYQVVPGMPAANAGLRGVQYIQGSSSLGDIIEGIDGKYIQDFNDLYMALDAHKVGDPVYVRYRRGDDVFDAQVWTTLLDDPNLM